MLALLFAVIGGILGGFLGKGAGALLGILGGIAAGIALKQHLRRQDNKAGDTRTDSRYYEPRMGMGDGGGYSHVSDTVRALRTEVAELRQRVHILETRLDAGGMAPVPVETEQTQVRENDTVLAPPLAARIEVQPEAPAAAPAVQAVAKPAPVTAPADEDAIMRKVHGWLFGGNTLVLAGALVLFFGLAFLFKFAAEHMTLPLELRYLGAGVGALVMLGIGWRLRARRFAYAMVLQGLGVAILYLLAFAAFRLHKLIPGGLTFAVLAATCALSAVLAVLQNARSLAIVGISGGFLAPLLASTGQGSHVMLFSYYLLLNVGIAGIAWFKTWRPLNVLGFLFTFGIGTLWGVKNYRDAMFSTTEPFLLLHFALFLAVTLFYAKRRKEELSGLGAATIAGERVDYVDGLLLFGVPIAGFGLQYLMVRNMEFGAALSALGLGMIYLPLAVLLYRRHQEDYRVLVESFLALGTIFATLAIPFALDAKWTSAAWAAEGLGIYWIGLRQRRRLSRAFALLLQLGAGVSLLLSLPAKWTYLYDGTHPSPNAFLMGALFLAAAGLCTGWLIHRHADRLHENERPLGILALLWGLLWWWLAGTHEIRRHLAEHSLTAHLLFAAASAQLLLLAGNRLRWREANLASMLLLPLLAAFGIMAWQRLMHPFADYGWLAWPLALASLYFVLYRQEREAGGMPDSVREWGHAIALWLVTALASWQVRWCLDELSMPGTAWPILGVALPPIAVLALAGWSRLRGRWPICASPRAYGMGATPIAASLWVWVVFGNLHSSGLATPLPYLPLINPLDLATGASLLALIVWSRMAVAQVSLDEKIVRIAVPAVLGLTAFFWLNGMLLRTLSRWADIPFILHVMLNSTLVQAALSLFWALIGLATMLWATRQGVRAAWLSGGGLMGLVVLKLFIVDLSKVGTLERIISFIGVGILLLLLGYFSPVPPKQGEGK